MSLEEIRYWKDYYKHSVNTWDWGYRACKQRLEDFEKKELEFIITNMNLKKVKRHGRTD